MKTITIGMVGAGFAAHLHGKGYAKLHGVKARLKTVVDLDEQKARKVADTYGFERVSTDYHDILNDEDIDVVDIVTSPDTHLQLTLAALQAGKHVICEKPLTGYFGRADDPHPIGTKVSKQTMYETVLGELEEAKKIIKSTEKMFMYAENYVYSPNVLKAAELIRSKKSKILYMKGEETIRGSTSPVSGMWNKTGGGCLIRTGCHPLSAVLWLKQEEASARNESISVESVVADTGNIASALTDYEKRHLTGRPVDVEDFVNVTVTFSDGTKAIVMSSDHVLGGVKNYVEIYANDGVLLCNITPTDNLSTYFLDEDGLDNIYFSEMLNEKIGWNKLFIAEDVLRGYSAELQDFMECIAYGRKPLSDIDLACETIKVIYAAYVSASEGRKVTFV